jgi:signal peptidase I
MRPKVPAKYASSEWAKNQYIMEKGRQIVRSHEDIFGEIVYRPVDRRDNYVKRCVALPGDVLEIKDNQVYINGKKGKNPKGLQYVYQIKTDGTVLNDRFFERLGISNDDKLSGSMPPYYMLPLTQDQLKQIKTYSFIKEIIVQDFPADSTGHSVFPYSADYPWSRDNFGPLKMPKKGETIDLNIKNLVIYDRIITAYEGNKLEVKGDDIYINGKNTNTYTFKMNYYFMLGDNRHKSADSRYWGFVPEDHVVGKPLIVWLSLDKDKSFLQSIRWNRFFKVVDRN